MKHRYLSVCPVLFEIGRSIKSVPSIDLVGRANIVLGNMIGSDIFNILAVLGLSASGSPDGINVSQAALRFDILVLWKVRDRRKRSGF